jgi:hypothetical protein
LREFAARADTVDEAIKALKRRIKEKRLSKKEGERVARRM